ncbi:HEPN domain-containing protein [Robiginitalea biformata]|uniref:HEPN domain-containing protein n=1 Tax=Robiginitalea biformata TaxID=252307 RepID=UPI0011D11809|nr:HEPN domain-containing protein [Robiginitalea biformata]
MNTANRGRKSTSQLELLRATVVFAHSTLEDFMRSIQAWKMPSTKSDHLNDVWLLENPRKTKFSIQEIYQFRSMKVEDLIEKSIKSYLDFQSYNQPTDLAKAIQSSGLTVSDEIKELFPKLAPLMSRRHHIVHQADRNNKVGSGHHKYKSLNLREVKDWISTIDSFAELLIIEIHNG